MLGIGKGSEISGISELKAKTEGFLKIKPEENATFSECKNFLDNLYKGRLEFASKEYEADKSKEHFESTYSLKPREQYEVNDYSYKTDQLGRIKQCEGTLRLEDGKRNIAHQTAAGGEYRLGTDEGGHLIGRQFGGSEKVDNIVPMDRIVNRSAYKELENAWKNELEKGNKVDVKIRCKYEKESTRPTEFIVKYRVTDQDRFTRNETCIINNSKPGGDLNE